MRKTFIFLIVLCFAASIFAQQPIERNKALNGTLFEDVTLASGIHHIGHGKCTALVDFDKDGDLDLYLGVVYGRNKFYQNQGNLRFVDISEPTGTNNEYDTHGAVFADFDNNGLIDLFVANNVEAASERRGIMKQPNALYMMSGEGTFVDMAITAGVAGHVDNFSCGVTTADVNGDGFLDLYVAKGGYRSGGLCANSLFINNGKAVFTDIAKQAGVADEGNGYCCAFADYDNDGDPDLYAGSLNEFDQPITRRLYRNDGNMKFTDVTEQLGIAAKGYDVSCFWGDVDNDGDLDLFLANSTGRGAASAPELAKNTLLRNNGDGTFTDISRESGVDIATNSRGCTMGDVDNDGDLDIYVTNSMSDALLFINDGKAHFTESAQKLGGAVFYAHGCAFGDLDDDGDLDLVAGNWRNVGAFNPGAWKLFQNKSRKSNYLKVNLQGTKSNRSAVMSRVYVYAAGLSGDKSALLGMREITAGNGTFPGNPLQAHFGLGKTKTCDLVVKFPSGITVEQKNVAAGQTISIVEPTK
jgi:hypothetical protein